MKSGKLLISIKIDFLCTNKEVWGEIYPQRVNSQIER